MKRIIGWALFAAIGLTLCASCYATASRGLSELDLNIYHRALGQQTRMDALGFENFRLSDYPVAYYDGGHDYVVDAAGVTTRNPVLDTFVGTAVEVDGHFEVLLPTLERMRGMISLLGAAFAGVNTGGVEYSEEDQIATIWHEGFHAYQRTHFSAQLAPFTSADPQALIARDVDKDAWQRERLGISLTALSQALAATDQAERLAAVHTFRTREQARREKLPEDTKAAEDQLLLIEGTAYYVECNVRGKQPLDGADETDGGSMKYYQMGAALCRVLDALDPSWKKDFDFSRNLCELLDEKAGLT